MQELSILSQISQYVLLALIGLMALVIGGWPGCYRVARVPLTTRACLAEQVLPDCAQGAAHLGLHQVALAIPYGSSLQGV